MKDITTELHKAYMLQGCLEGIIKNPKSDLTPEQIRNAEQWLVEVNEKIQLQDKFESAGKFFNKDQWEDFEGLAIQIFEKDIKPQIEARIFGKTPREAEINDLDL